MDFRDQEGTRWGQVHQGQEMDVYSGHDGAFCSGWLWGDDRFVNVHSFHVQC